MRRVGALLCVLVGTAAGLAACSSPEKLSGEGGPCQQATDCEEGLVCEPQANGQPICSSDLSSIQHTEEGGMADAAAPPKDAAPGDGRARVDAAADTAAPQDTGAGDTAQPSGDSGGD